MDIFLLGAGKPARGDKPSALKKISFNTKAIDWQIHGFKFLNDRVDLHYLGGYHVDEVIRDYPELNFTVIPDWDKHSVLHTLLQAPFSKDPVIISYSDTVFRKDALEDITSNNADIVFAYDSQWEKRFQSRSKEDIAAAETISLSDFSKTGIVEFTGLIYLKPNVVEFLSTVNESQVGKNLVDLIYFLKSKGFSVEPCDVVGHWAELNAPADIAHFILGTKAETLARIEPLVKKSHVGKQVSFTIKDWEQSEESVLSLIDEIFTGVSLVVRSSARGEDNWNCSNAGGFESVLNVDGNSVDKIKEAIKKVIVSYGKQKSQDDQVLVQEFVENSSLSGVVFTCGLETGSPYYKFNFDDQTKSTESVTSGICSNLRTVIVSRLESGEIKHVEPSLVPVIDAVNELEELLQFDKLDIEFAIDENNVVHIFQVRPITVDHSSYEVEDENIATSLSESKKRFIALQKQTPFIFGENTFFGNMSDWNPAEIIGIRPKPLSFSLYRKLITDKIWATQRSEFGYRDVRPNPLIVSFSGHPYVDIRASFNSFIPASLDDSIANKLVTAYLSILKDNHHFHDKIEFDIVFTAWTPGFVKEATERLSPYGFNNSNIIELEKSLKVLTCEALERLGHDIKSIETLKSRRKEIEDSDLTLVDKIYTLLDDCSRFGTLAFSHAARAGFISSILLKSFVNNGILTEKRFHEFMESINTVAKELGYDKHLESKKKLSRKTLLEKYGHLRPGTYEVAVQAYWEDPEKYFISDTLQDVEPKTDFVFTKDEAKKVQEILSEMGSKLDPKALAEYLCHAIESRERVKFEFTNNLSMVLDLCVDLSKIMKISRDDMSYLEYEDLEQLKLNVIGLDTVKQKILKRKKTYVATQLIDLPSLIFDEKDFYCFERHRSEPNFITMKRIESQVCVYNCTEPQYLEDKIVLIEQADPGFDWLFGCQISGLITKYGGANSHMAIRAAEIGLPAVIGVGEKLFDNICRMKKIEIDCPNKIIREIR